MRSNSIPPDVSKKRKHLIVVFLWDRIDLVIMTAGAVDGQADHGLTGRGQDVVKIVIQRQLGVSRLIVPLPETIVTRCDDRIVRRFLQFISGQLFPSKTDHRVCCY